MWNTPLGPAIAHFAVLLTPRIHPRASSINIVFQLLCVSICSVFALFACGVSLLYPFLCSDRHVERNNWRDGGVRRARSLVRRGFTFFTTKNHKLMYGYWRDKSQNLIQAPSSPVARHAVPPSSFLAGDIAATMPEARTLAGKASIG